MKAKFEAYSLELQEVLIGTPRASTGDQTIENILIQLRSRQVAREQVDDLSGAGEGGGPGAHAERGEGDRGGAVGAHPVADPDQGARERRRRRAGARPEGRRDRQGDGGGESARNRAWKARARPIVRWRSAPPTRRPPSCRSTPTAGPEYRLAEQNFSRFADALTKINQPLVPQFLMSGAQGQENSSGGLIPTALLSSLFGRMMPDALEKLKQEAPKPSR